MIRFGNVRVDRFQPARNNSVLVGGAVIRVMPENAGTINQISVMLAGVDLFYHSSDHHIRRIIAKATVSPDSDRANLGHIANISVEVLLADQDPSDDPFNAIIDLTWIADTTER